MNLLRQSCSKNNAHLGHKNFNCKRECPHLQPQTHHYFQIEVKSFGECKVERITFSFIHDPFLCNSELGPIEFFFFFFSVSEPPESLLILSLVTSFSFFNKHG